MYKLINKGIRRWGLLFCHVEKGRFWPRGIMSVEIKSALLKVHGHGMRPELLRRPTVAWKEDEPLPWSTKSRPEIETAISNSGIIYGCQATLQKRNASINKRDRNVRKNCMETHKN